MLQKARAVVARRRQPQSGPDQHGSSVRAEATSSKTSSRPRRMAAQRRFARDLIAASARQRCVAATSGESSLQVDDRARAPGRSPNTHVEHSTRACDTRRRERPDLRTRHVTAGRGRRGCRVPSAGFVTAVCKPGNDARVAPRESGDLNAFDSARASLDLLTARAQADAALSQLCDIRLPWHPPSLASPRSRTSSRVRPYQSSRWRINRASF